MFNEEALREVMSAVLNVPVSSIGPDASMDNIGEWDSLQHIKLVLAVEEEFGVSIPDEDVANVTSYALLKVVLRELLQSEAR
jgi:acyl carrier protein